MIREGGKSIWRPTLDLNATHNMVPRPVGRTSVRQSAGRRMDPWPTRTGKERSTGTAAGAAFAGEARSHRGELPPDQLCELALQANRAGRASPDVGVVPRLVGTGARAALASGVRSQKDVAVIPA